MPPGSIGRDQVYVMSHHTVKSHLEIENKTSPTFLWQRGFRLRGETNALGSCPKLLSDANLLRISRDYFIDMNDSDTESTCSLCGFFIEDSAHHSSHIRWIDGPKPPNPIVCQPYIAFQQRHCFLFSSSSLLWKMDLYVIQLLHPVKTSITMKTDT